MSKNILMSGEPVTPAALVSVLVDDVLRCMARLEADQADLQRAFDALHTVLEGREPPVLSHELLSQEQLASGLSRLSQLRSHRDEPAHHDPLLRLRALPSPADDADTKASGVASEEEIDGLLDVEFAPLPPANAVHADELLAAEFGLRLPGQQRSEVMGTVDSGRPEVLLAPSPPDETAPSDEMSPPDEAALPDDVVDQLLSAEFGTGAGTTPAHDAPTPETTPEPPQSDPTEDLIASVLGLAPATASTASKEVPPTAGRPDSKSPTVHVAGSDVPLSDDRIDSVLQSLSGANGGVSSSSVTSPGSTGPEMTGPEMTGPETAEGNGGAEVEVVRGTDELTAAAEHEFLRLERRKRPRGPGDGATEGAARPLWRAATETEVGSDEGEEDSHFFDSELPNDDFFVRATNLHRTKRG